MLALVAPAGFSEGDRNLWLRSATLTLAGIPEDLLRRGIIHARLTCDHPSKVIPAIMDEIGIAWSMRLKQAHTTRDEPAALPAPIEPDDGVRMTVDEIRALTGPLRVMALGKGWLTEEELAAAAMPENNA